MKKEFQHITLGLFFLLILSCSREVNNAYTRFHHNLNTYFNVYFNQKEYYYKGLEQKKKEYTPDFNEIIPVFMPISKESKSVGAGDFKKSIEKGIKAITLRSIKAKPDYGKSYSALSKEEKEFYNKNEYNAFIDDVHLYMGDAYYQIGELDSALIQYQFITYEYPNDASRYAAYLRMSIIATDRGLYDQANEYVTLANHINADNATIDAVPAAYAHMYLNQNKYKLALSHLKASLARKSDLIRADYIAYDIAKIYDMLGKNKLAANYFNIAESESSDYEFILNCQIARLVLKTTDFNYKLIMEQLSDMLDDERNYEYEYKIYHYLGTLEEELGHLAIAVNHYKYALKANKKDNSLKVQTAIKLGNILFEDFNFYRALQAYEIADQNISISNRNYTEVKNKIKTLKEITELSKIVYKADKKKSFLLQKNSEGELLEDVVIREKEKRAESSILSLMNMENTDKWYFYNKSLTEKGKQDFIDTWGEVKLVDNWRYSNRESYDFENFDIENLKDTLKVKNKIVTKEVKKNMNSAGSVELSHSQAIMKLADVYHYRIGLKENARKLYKMHLNQYPNSKFDSFIYYQLLKLTNSIEYRNLLLANYPNSVYAQVIKSEQKSKQLYISKSQEKEFYNQTFAFFLKGDYQTSLSRLSQLNPDSEYKEQLNYIEAVSRYKVSNNKKEFISDLESLIKSAQDSLISLKSTRLLSSLKTKEKAPKSSYFASNQTIDKSEEKAEKENPTIPFSFKKEENHFFVLMLNSTKAKDVNLIKFGINSYLIEEAENIDLSVINTYLGNGVEMISVKSFENLYKSLEFMKNISPNLNNIEALGDKEYVMFTISQKDMLEMVKNSRVSEYINFFYDNYQKLSF